MAQKLDPLYKLDRPHTRWNWSDDADKAFCEVKTALAEMAKLSYIQPNVPLELVVDPSNTAMGATLQQTINNDIKPLAYFSKCFKQHQAHWSTFDRELSAIPEAIKHFRYLFEARPFVIWTDHRPLTTAMRASLEKSPRQERMLDFIAQFSTDIRHIAGKSNTVADNLSRIAAITWSIDQLIEHQRDD